MVAWYRFGRMSHLPSLVARIAFSTVCAAVLVVGNEVDAQSEEATVTAAPAVVTEDVWGGAKIVGGREAPGYVAFTFDDGPDLTSTPIILKTLEAHKVPATFFVVGRHFAKKSDTAKAGAELLVDMEKRGFTIGNHTTNHQNLPKLSPKAAQAAVATNASDLEAVLGHPVRLFRPPFGATTGAIRRMLRKRGDTMVRWNIDSQDFQRDQRKGMADRVLAEILSKGGGVVLFHDTKKATARMLPSLLASLELANCQRIEDGQPAILPVSLHYFLRDPDGTPRRIPAKVLKETQDMVDRLTEQCKDRD